MFLRQTSPRMIGGAVAATILTFDQLHKAWMLYGLNIMARQPIRLTPFLDVVLSWNFGVSYSLFAAHAVVARVLLIGLQSLIVALLIYWLARSKNLWTCIALGGVIGGALGNMTDRVFRGAVADFFYFHSTLPVGPLANYVFNLADVGITIGAGLLLFESLTLGPSSTPDHSHDRSDIK